MSQRDASRPSARLLLVGEAAFSPPIRAALAGEGYEARIEPDASTALAALAASQFDLLMTDWSSPGLDGIGLTRAVRASLGLADLHIVVLAPVDPTKPAVRALEAGADDYLIVPFDLSQLLARLRVGLRAAQLRASEARLRALVDNVPGAIYRCAHDADWTMDLISDEIEGISGYPAQDFIGNACRSFASIIHPDDSARVDRVIAAAAGEERPFAVEYRIVDARGAVRWVAERGQLVHGGDGRTWLDGAIFDVTHRRQAEEELRRAHADQALGEQRTALARELHDVVAHGLSVVALQSSGARLNLERDPARSERALAAIETSTRQALAEMRLLLDVLRGSEEPLGLGVHPGLAQLEALVETVRGAGLPVAVRVEGEVRPLLPMTDLSAYRIIQEAFTNSLKHAGPARAWLDVRYTERALEIEVRDDGGGAARPANDPAPNGGGHGLSGIRERVGLLGGTLQVGPRPEGGFEVKVRLQLEEPPPRSA